MGLDLLAVLAAAVIIVFGAGAVLWYVLHERADGSGGGRGPAARG